MQHDGWVGSANLRSTGWPHDHHCVLQIELHEYRTQLGAQLGRPMRAQWYRLHRTVRFDNSLIVTASFNHTAQIWKWQRTRPLPVMKQSAALVSAFFNFDGSRVATVSKQGAQVWDAKTGQSTGPSILPENPTDCLSGASISSDGELLLTTTNGVAQVWNVKTGISAGQKMPVSSLLRAQFSPDGKLVMTVSDHEVSLTDLRSGQPF